MMMRKKRKMRPITRKTTLKRMLKRKRLTMTCKKRKLRRVSLKMRSSKRKKNLRRKKLLPLPPLKLRLRRRKLSLLNLGRTMSQY